VTPSESVTPRQWYSLGFAVMLPVCWLVGILSIGFVQLAIDPDAQESSGHALDLVSWYVWMAGLVVVPATSAFFARRFDAPWSGAIGLAILGSMIYVLGTLAVFAIWVAGYEGVTGTEWA
jgi:hypothetical protein